MLEYPFSQWIPKCLKLWFLFFFSHCTAQMPHFICIYFARRSETITTFPVGHAAHAFVHCAGGVSRKFHNILVPGDASSIPQIDETPAICAAPWRQCSFQRFCSWFAYLPVDSAHGLAFPAFCMELVFKSPTSCILVLIATDQPTSIYRHRILQSTNESYQECPYGKAKASSRSCQLPSCR
jgi:hypothetical protein